MGILITVLGIGGGILICGAMDSKKYDAPEWGLELLGGIICVVISIIMMYAFSA